MEDKKIEHYILTWLSMIEGIDYYIFLKLLKAFNFLENIFEFSKNKMLFQNILIQNHVFLSSRIFNQLVSSKLKQDALYIYNNLKRQEIKFISIFSKDYPKYLKEYPETPLLLFAKGDIEVLNSFKYKRVYFYSSNIEVVKHSKSISKILNYALSKENIIKIFQADINNQLCNKQVVFKVSNIFDINFVSNSLKKDSLCIYIPENAKYTELLKCSISDTLFVLNASFEDEIEKIASYMLDMGKQIVTIPGSISDRNFSFSNYLLRDGANVVLNIKDIDTIFGNIW